MAWRYTNNHFMFVYDLSDRKFCLVKHIDVIINILEVLGAFLLKQSFVGVSLFIKI